MPVILDITPVAKPRMTRADKWKKRKSVLKYRAFCDHLNLILPIYFDINGLDITFVLPMPKSWSKKQKALMNAQPHTLTPDIDNMLKALLDAFMSDDSGVWCIGRLEKRWAYQGCIIIQ